VSLQNYGEAGQYSTTASQWESPEDLPVFNSGIKP